VDHFIKEYCGLEGWVGDDDSDTNRESSCTPSPVDRSNNGKGGYLRPHRHHPCQHQVSWILSLSSLSKAFEKYPMELIRNGSVQSKNSQRVHGFGIENAHIRAMIVRAIQLRQ
jgi:hypothetical protein